MAVEEKLNITQAIRCNFFLVQIECKESPESLNTAGSHYCCTAQYSLNGDQLTAHFEVHLEKHA